MAIQTLNTIKNWFKTGLKPSQQQFWDTWDSFRHKFEKVPVKDIEGIDELLLTKADKTVLDNHLADKNAHAPQVNTDWNSESGFSQLLNKPEFKTINGEEIVGDGDITISSAIPTLDQVLNSDNKSLTQPIVFLDEEYSATIDSKSLSIDGPLGESIQYNGDNINWSKGDKNLKLLFDGESAGQNTFTFPEMPDSSAAYKLATDQVVSATQSGLVDNTSLQELGGVDKLINGVRVGKGNLATTSSNTVLGSNSLMSVITGGTNNTAVGRNVMPLATSAPANTGIGSLALNALTTGSSNVGIGASSLKTITTGSFNMGVGNATLQKVITASNNTAIGAHAGSRITGSKNTAIGFLSQGMSGTDSTGESNITIGLQAGGQITSGSNNVLIENQETPGSTITSGSNNVILKQGSASTGVITGNNNTIIGNATGLSSDASNLVILADGSGNIAVKQEADNSLLAPTLTNTLIDSGGAKSLVTKEYLDFHSAGGIQTFQQVLQTGSYGNLVSPDNSHGSGINITVNNFASTFQAYTGSQGKNLSLDFEDNINLSFTGASPSNFKNSFIIDGALSNSNIYLPKPSISGNYTLATEDQITLQKALDNNPSASIISNNGLNESGLNFYTTDSYIYSGLTSIKRDIESSSDAGFIGHNNGIPNIMRAYNGTDSKRYELILDFEKPTKDGPNVGTQVTRISVPAKTPKADPFGHYTLSTAEQFSANGEYPGTNAGLNTLYPEAQNGDTVIFKDAIQPAIFTKIPTGWIGSIVKVLP